MGNFFHGIFQFVFLISYVILFIVSIILLRPFRKHKRRLYSTISLKVSYLLFLSVFLIFTYLLLFGEKVVSENEQAYDTLFNKHFLVFLTSIIVPNIGIMARRKVKKKRSEYNMIFSATNILYALYLLFLIISGQWALL